jgi:hypothetical protein
LCYARKRRVESFEKRDKDVKRGKSEEKNMCMEKKETKMKSKEKIYVYERLKKSD